MPVVSKRGNNMPSSPIRKLVPFAEKAKEQGKKIYHLNIGQPDIETPEVALKAIKNTSIKIIEYSHSAGFISYRKKITNYYKQFKIDIATEDVLITTGGSEAILMAFMVCLDPGDEIIIPEPFYANYNGFACAAGAKVVPLTSYISNGYALPPLKEFEKLITKKTKAILICNPNNPTGYLYSKDELESLKQVALKHNLFLMSDEVYREFCYDGQTHFSVMHLHGADENIILLDSVSKRFSACGARIGSLISRNKNVMDSALKFAQARLSPPTLGQIVAEASVDTPQSYIDHVIDEYLLRRNIVVTALNKMQGVVCPTPGGAFYAMAKLPIDNADKFCKWLLESFEYNNKTVMLAPGSGFYSTPDLGNDEVRIAYVLNKEDLQNAMECLDVALKAYPGRISTQKLTAAGRCV